MLWDVLVVVGVTAVGAALLLWVVWPDSAGGEPHDGTVNEI